MAIQELKIWQVDVGKYIFYSRNQIFVGCGEIGRYIVINERKNGLVVKPLIKV